MRRLPLFSSLQWFILAATSLHSHDFSGAAAISVSVAREHALNAAPTSPAIALGTLRSMVEEYVRKFKANKLSFARETKLRKRQLELKMQLKDEEGIQNLHAFAKNERDDHVSQQESYVGTVASTFSHFSPALYSSIKIESDVSDHR
mmetsp:Transcript_25438/g.64076  ORF Transcript_25438/g.64076 Transcript_25438/m.64076 type:complete len:147 (-) Transcript_25438:20-460(-)